MHCSQRDSLSSFSDVSTDNYDFVQFKGDNEAIHYFAQAFAPFIKPNSLQTTKS